MILFAYVQENWVMIGLLIAALIVVLKAIAHFRVRWAKITPDKADDEQAKLFSKKIDVITGFFREIFLPSKKKKNDGGFISIWGAIALSLFLIGIVLGCLLQSRFSKPAVAAAPAPEYIEVIKYLKDESGSKKGKISTTKEFNCPDGGVSKEVSIEEFLEEHQSRSSQDVAKKVEELEEKKLDVFLGGGAQIQTGENLRAVEKINPQLAGGAAYDKYGGFAASDFNKSHAVYAFRHWSF